jgi:hypothetical protein
MIVILVLIALLYPAFAEDANRTAWILNPSTTARGSAPEVHSLEVRDGKIVVRSAGISLYQFGALQSRTGVPKPHRYEFQIPAAPKPGKEHLRLPASAIGVFVTGVPIWNAFENSSYQGQNLWHYDTIARSDDGTITATGQLRPETDGLVAPELLRNLLENGSRHSPILGFAFDGYPIYGPWGYANADGTGGLKRLRSSYRLRKMSVRAELPDGTELSSTQRGPDVSDEFPLGTFAEDYLYAPGSGDLDEFNGRFAKTPEYPNGTYAYYLGTDRTGRLAYPYFVGPRYYGEVTARGLSEAFLDGTRAVEPEFTATVVSKKIGALSLSVLATAGSRMSAEQPVLLRFRVTNAKGNPVRFLEHVHERPIHLIVVSEDLAQFDHIHPEITPEDNLEVAYTFQNGGKYRLYADFTAPGAKQLIETFDLDVHGSRRAPETLSTTREPLAPGRAIVARAGGLNILLQSGSALTAQADHELRFQITNASTGEPVRDLEPYLGAWAHFVLIREGWTAFVHAHPIESGAKAVDENQPHVHAPPPPPGPSPDVIRTNVSFAEPGFYKLWAQFQRKGEVITVPFVLRVDPAVSRSKTPVEIPASAVRVRVSSNGYTPASVRVAAGQPIVLAFERDATAACGNKVVFPSLKVERDLPIGETVLVELPAQAGGEIRFTCGMGMYKGSLIAIR